MKPYSIRQLKSTWHDDVIKWKYFPCHWPLGGESTGDRWISLTTLVVIGNICYEQEHYKISLNFEFDRNIFSGMGARSSTTTCWYMMDMCNKRPHLFGCPHWGLVISMHWNSEESVRIWAKRIIFSLPARWTSGFSADHQQNHQCLWFPTCYNVTRVCCPSLFVFCWE